MIKFDNFSRKTFVQTHQSKALAETYLNIWLNIYLEKLPKYCTHYPVLLSQNM